MHAKRILNLVSLESAALICQRQQTNLGTPAGPARTDTMAMAQNAQVRQTFDFQPIFLFIYCFFFFFFFSRLLLTFKLGQGATLGK